jgi:SAM domain (Sterile alpha motif)
LPDDIGQRANQDTVMDIAGWLRSLGLEKYEAVLRDNEIDDADLPKLTEDHLRELEQIPVDFTHSLHA